MLPSTGTDFIEGTWPYSTTNNIEVTMSAFHPRNDPCPRKAETLWFDAHFDELKSIPCGENKNPSLENCDMNGTFLPKFHTLAGMFDSPSKNSWVSRPGA